MKTQLYVHPMTEIIRVYSGSQLLQETTNDFIHAGEGEFNDGLFD